jgi:hypothetical protein
MKRIPIEEIIAHYGIRGIHPALALIPMMSDRTFQALCRDVEQHGFLHSVRITDDFILIDGRARLQAGWALELDPHIERFNPPEVLAYVLSENLIRQQLSEDQLAMIATRISKKDEKYVRLAEKEQT